MPSDSEPTGEPLQEEDRPTDVLTKTNQDSPTIELTTLLKRARELEDQIARDMWALITEYTDWEDLAGVTNMKDPKTGNESGEAGETNEAVEYYFEYPGDNERKAFGVTRKKGITNIIEYSTDEQDLSSVKPLSGLNIGSDSAAYHKHRIFFTFRDSTARTMRSTIIDHYKKGLEADIEGDKDPLLEGRRILDELKKSQIKGVVGDREKDGFVVKPLPGDEGPPKIIRYASRSSSPAKAS